MDLELVFVVIFGGGWLAGTIAEKLRLPPILGMTVYGIFLTGVSPMLFPDPAKPFLPESFVALGPFLKSLALVVILLRAGLGISRKELGRAGWGAVLMAVLPCIFEGFALTLLCMGFFGMTWEIAGVAGFMLAAVSPAVVVPSMLELRDKGYGKESGVITLVLAGASADDAVAITIFSLFLGLAQGSGLSSPLQSLALLPLSLAGGLVLGLGAGWLLAWWFRTRHGQIRATEKALLLIASGFVLVQVGHWIQIAALLGVMAAGFMMVERAPVQAAELASKLAKVWVPAQIVLFVLIGLSLDPGVLGEVGVKGLAVLVLGLVARSCGVVLALTPTELSWREKIFCVIAYVPKATVQAALGGSALAAGLPGGQIILAMAVLAILVTAPLGLLGIRWGVRFLQGGSTVGT